MRAPVDVDVDLAAAEPVYEQVRRQIAGYIATGTLADGQRLPPIVALAADLGVAGNTVARAYKELEAAGLVTTRRRTGTLVTRNGAAVTAPSTTSAARAYAVEALGQGLTESEAVDLLRAAYREAPRP